jgi:opacity protein-like surface antigen
MGLSRWLAAMVCLLMSSVCVAQNVEGEMYSRKTSWTIFTEYSNTSSHLLMGASRQRELVTLGGAYTRRVVRFWGSQLNYQAEIRPVVFESDPVAITSTTYSVESGTTPVSLTFVRSGAPVGVCQPASGTSTLSPPGQPVETVTYSTVCGRQWTFAQAFSPLGFKYSLLTRKRVQPFAIGTLGYMYSSRPLPVAEAEALNFAFDFGVGVEIYRPDMRSISLECRYHHFSNRNTADENSGVDSLMYKLSYSFGRNGVLIA